MGKQKHLLMTALLLMGLPMIVAAQQVNYDESKVGPYTLEDPLQFADGKLVKDAADWAKRRTEILQLFQQEMYGQMPAPCHEVVTEVIEEGVTLAGFGIRRQVRMWFRADKTGPKVDWMIVAPRHIKEPVPAIIFLNYVGNQSLLPDKEILVTDGWLRNNEANFVKDHRTTEQSRGMFVGPNSDTVCPLGMILARGYAVVTACYGEISPDPNRDDAPGRNLQDDIAYTGIFDLWGTRDASRQDNTTALAAWAWVLMRGMDMIERDAALDARKVVVTGCSRLGKAALLAGAFDERFPVVVPVQTGGGGVPLAKRNFGETIATEVASFTHWYCRAYDKYAGKEETMPFDQHLLLACVAPRALLVEGFDKEWFDTKGEFLSVQAASPVWTFLGKEGLPAVEWPDDYDTKAIGKDLGYVRRDQEHGISALDWTWMMDFADSVFGK
ncbi:MAG: hypothetical protein Q4E55_00755 [Bacteroidales bacterium]|nr:hypothetical protein [Bacteroidales bacterium]